MPRSHPLAGVNGDGGARFMAPKVLAGHPESIDELWKLAASSGWLGEVYGFVYLLRRTRCQRVRAGRARSRRRGTSLRPPATASWCEVVQTSFKTPRRDLGRLGIVGIVVFSVSSTYRSAVSYVEHLRLAVVLARAREKRRGKGRAWVVRATRERWGVIAQPEGARRRRPYTSGAATAPLNYTCPKPIEELLRY